MTPPNLPAAPEPNDASNKDMARNAAIPAFIADAPDDLSAYRSALGTQDPIVVKACIHQLEQRLELVKQSRAEATSARTWAMTQAALSWTVTVPLLVTSIVKIHHSHAGGMGKFLGYMFSAIWFGVWIGMSFLTSSRSDDEPRELRKLDKALRELLAQFQTLKDRLEDSSGA